MAYKRTNKKAGTKAKRGWYLDARIGKNVPILGGTGIRLGKRAVQKIARREVMKAEETKIFNTTMISSTVLTHNTFYTLSPIQGITIGTSDSTRVGQSIFIRHIKVAGNIFNAAGQAEVTFRIVTLWTDEQYLQGWAFTAGQIQVGSLFYGSNDGTTALFNNKLGNTVICDRKITVKQQYSGSLVKKHFEYDCPIFQRVQYNSGSALLNKKQLYVVVIPYTPGGASGSTAVGSFEIQAITTYKDA